MVAAKYPETAEERRCLQIRNLRNLARRDYRTKLIIKNQNNELVYELPEPIE